MMASLMKGRAISASGAGWPCRENLLLESDIVSLASLSPMEQLLTVPAKIAGELLEAYPTNRSPKHNNYSLCVVCLARRGPNNQHEHHSPRRQLSRSLDARNALQSSWVVCIGWEIIRAMRCFHVCAHVLVALVISTTLLVPVVGLRTTRTGSSQWINGRIPTRLDGIKAPRNPGYVSDKDAIRIGAAGIAANIVCDYSLYVLRTTACGLPPGILGLEGAAEGVSYLVVVGIFGWSLKTFFQRGGGLEAGPFGLLGLAEGLTYLTVVGGVVVAVLNLFQYGFLPGFLPDAACFGQ